MNGIRKIRILFSPDKNLFLSIYNIFGFYPRNIDLYKLALVNKSVTRERNTDPASNNERLEYLGDAVLSSVVAEYLFKKFPYRDEGFLTEMRSRMVSRLQLNRLSRKLGFDRLIHVNQTQNHNKSVLGNTFEAFVGAMYLDKGYGFTKKTVIKRIIGVHLDLDKLEKEDLNYKSQIVEWSQKEKVTMEFRVIGEDGIGNRKQYIVGLFLNGESVSTGQDFSIKGAEQLASEKALIILRSEVQDI